MNTRSQQRPATRATHGSWAVCRLALAYVYGAWVVAAPSSLFAQAAPGSWSSAQLCDIAAWPHAQDDVRLSATPQGLRVEVAEQRYFAIAAASQLALPAPVGRLRIEVAEISPQATWFVRLYGDVRESGKPRTVSVAEGVTTAGQWVIQLDPRLRQNLAAPVQLQLGVEGAPGAFARFCDIDFLPPLPRANCLPRTVRQLGQLDIAAVELMPNIPQPFQLIDWRAKAQAYDRFVFDLNTQGTFLPLLWLDDTRINIDRPTFGLPSYVGAVDQHSGRPNSQEGITCIGAVLGATLAGLDKRGPDHDYVAMCEAWFNTRNGLQLVLNRQDERGGASFWYELFPHIVFYALSDRYPDQSRLSEIVRVTADRWRDACHDLAGGDGVPNFDHTSFDFRARQSVDNGKWREPDAAAAVAWLQYAAWMKFQDPTHLAAAEGCLQFLQQCPTNPYYEVLLPFGALTAARLNAELEREYDVDRLLNWCFGISDCRGGWGVIVGNWGDYDCDGLVGSIDNRGGYAFMMNTCAQAGALVPLARYDTRYARALGKWMLNLANAARLFYPGELPPGHASSEFWTGDPQHVIAYEGLRYAWQGMSPCATGDPVAFQWGPQTDLGLYGSSYVGLLGAIVRATSDRQILQLDCLATDFFRTPAFPTSLCYNPHSERREFTIAVGTAEADIYDAAAHALVARRVSGNALVSLPPDSAGVFVLLPAGQSLVREGRRVRCQGIVIDWHAAM
ncbi:MAG: hypothetical protein ACYC4U_07805 [Pirellulaceae bacterium]